MMHSLFALPLHHLYLLQLENYNLVRYPSVLMRRGWRSVTVHRQQLVWTKKIIAIATLAFILQTATAIGIMLGGQETALFGIIVWLAGYCLFGVWAAITVALLQPVDYALKRWLVFSARRILRRYPRLTIIGITGSYGKTTMKEVLATVLAEQYVVVKTEGNQNTPLGLARLVKTAINDRTDILIVEMGAYQEGDIAALCAIAPPHISLVTGINEAHLERFGSLETTIRTKFEIVRAARPNALVILNADDEHVREHAPHWVAKKHPLVWYSGKNHPLCPYTVGQLLFNSEQLQQTATIAEGKTDLGTFSTKLLGSYAWGVAIAALLVGHHQGMTHDAVRRGIAVALPLPHRLQPIRGAGNVVVIDDSYNGNPAGVAEALAVLSKFTTKRKIYVTPGLVEMGERTAAVHQEIGRQLAQAADLVILIENSTTAPLVTGLQEQGFLKTNLVIAPTALAAHEKVRQCIQPDDVVLFQNDWPDNYS